MLREFRASDGPRLIELLLRYFPEESSLLGYRRDQFDRTVARIYRWHIRLILFLARLVGHPIFLFWVLEVDGRIAATTQLSFTERAGYVSMVSVEEPFRGRGYAKRLMAVAEEGTRKARRPYLVLDVLTNNAPARHLYERIGFGPLRSQSYYVAELPPASGPETPPLPAGIRLFRRSDEPALSVIAGSLLPPEVARVLPVNRNVFHLPPAVYAALGSVSEAWVIDRGRGAEGFLRATMSTAMEAGNLTAPILGEGVGLEEARTLVETGGRWLAAHGAPRAVVETAHYNGRALVALKEAGYREALGIETLVKPTGAR